MGPLGPVRIPCPFCDRMHEGDYWDDAEEQVMECRERASARKRGDLEAYAPEELEGFTVRETQIETPAPMTV